MIEQYSSLYQPIFTFAPPQFKPNKLIDKMVPAIEVDTAANTIKCKDGDAQVTTIRAQHCLPINGIVAYFEVEIIKCNAAHPDDCGVNVGLITKDGNPRAYAGKYMNSIGQINGQIFLNKKKVSTFPAIQLGKKDRIGCGINCSNSSFFFTKNSEIFIKDIVLPEGNKWNEFYPAVALQHAEETVKCYFEKKDFLFDIEKFASQIQLQGKYLTKKVKTQVMNQDEEEIPSSEIYSLISEYMLFNGYSKTLQLMKQKKDEIQFEPVNKLTKSIQGTKVIINLDEEAKNAQTQKKNEPQISESLMKQENEQEQKQRVQIHQLIQPIQVRQTRKSSRTRDRIMSQVPPEILPEQGLMIQQQDQPRRKNTQFGQYLIPENKKMRKQSNLSNVSLIDDESINHNIAEQKIFPNMGNHSKNEQNTFQENLTLNEKFLLNERLEILSLIKDKKIECAQKIIIAKIPKLYEVEPLLQAHMKAHIFLRKIIEEDQTSAINYGRTQQKFANNIDKLFPTYDQETGLIEMIPMKKILTSIVISKNKQHKFLRKQQFEYFAEYVNSLIMKSMGVMGNSRLGVILEHTSIVLRKLQEFKGMSCGIKLLN